MINKQLENLMNIQPETLAENQHKALKQHVINTLNNIRILVENEKYDDILDSQVGNIFYSPAGDGYGCNNYCINFAYEQGLYCDIQEIVSKLHNLSDIISVNDKKEKIELSTWPTEEVKPKSKKPRGTNNG